MTSTGQKELGKAEDLAFMSGEYLDRPLPDGKADYGTFIFRSGFLSFRLEVFHFFFVFNGKE